MDGPVVVWRRSSCGVPGDDGAAVELTEQALEARADRSRFGRGLDTVRYVRALRVVGSGASASVQGRSVHQATLDWSGDELRGTCTCPDFPRSWFCKHLVAVGLRVLEKGAGVAGAEQVDELARLVGQLGVEQLRGLVLDLARRDDTVRRELERLRAVEDGDTSGLADELLALVRGATDVRGFVDYRRSFEVAADVEGVLDELERCIDLPAPDAARPALRDAVTRLQALAGEADDSSGSIGDACQRAADLHARACREGSPDGVELARWLFRLRRDSPGWPDVELADVVDALGKDGLQAYRQAVAELDAKHARADRWARFEVDRMLLELADHDRDVDAAVALLSAHGSPQFGAIVQRLRDADRHDDALTWIDRAVAAGRVARSDTGNDYDLAPDDVADTYLDRGRVEDALEVLRNGFRRQPGAAARRRLLRVAERVGRQDTERAWALNAAREHAAQPYGNGAALVEIALADGDLDAAWQAAEEFGPGEQSRRLVDASMQARPLDAAALLREHVDQALAGPADSRVYPGVTSELLRIRELHRAGGDPQGFATYLAELRSAYGRRPSLMKQLDSAGLRAETSG